MKWRDSETEWRSNHGTMRKDINFGIAASLSHSLRSLGLLAMTGYNSRILKHYEQKQPAKNYRKN